MDKSIVFDYIFKRGTMDSGVPLTSSASLEKAFGKLKLSQTSRESDVRLPSVGKDEDCPGYSKIRETKNGRAYVIEKVQGKGFRRRYCRWRKNPHKEDVYLQKSVPHALMEQGEYVLEKTMPGKSPLDREERDNFLHQFRKGRSKTIWLGVPTDQLDCWDTRFLGYVFGQLLGKGSFGSVHEACQDNSCKWVLKISFLDDDFDKQVAAREIAIMEQLNDTGLIPRLLKWKMCDDMAMMLMDRWSMTAEQLGRQGYEHFFGKGSNVMNALMFTDVQINKIYALARKLSELGIIHGDLKLDNIMYRVHDDSFIIIDFGFTGTYKEHEGKYYSARWGFTHAMGCKQSEDSPVPQQLSRFANVWQLTVDIGSSVPFVLIGIEDRQTHQVQEIRYLAGLGPDYSQILNLEAIKTIQKECPNPNGDLARNRKQGAHIRTILARKLLPYWV